MQRRVRSVVGLWVAIALLAGACGGGAPLESEIGIGLDTMPVRAESAAAPTTTEPARTTTTDASPTTTASAADLQRTWVATAHDDVDRLTVFDEPDGEPIALPFLVPNPHQFGGPLTVMITEGEAGDDWVKVQIPLRPNGREGWLQTEDWDITSTAIRAEVILSRSLVVVYDGDTVIAESEAVIGAEASSTPLGTFFVAAKRRNPEEEAWLGPWALVLSSYSESFETFSGGLPVIAVHGTNRPDQLGEAITNGCVRVPNEVIGVLAEHVPLGAPVTVLS